MKKFLSVVLLLAMLIMSVGAMPCFADGELGAGNHFSGSMKRRMEKAQIIAEVKKDGTFVLRMLCFKKQGLLFGVYEAPGSIYPSFAKKLSGLKILNKIKEWKCDKALVIFGDDAKSHDYVLATFYDAYGRIIKSLEWSKDE